MSAVTVVSQRRAMAASVSPSATTTEPGRCGGAAGAGGTRRPAVVSREAAAAGDLGAGTLAAPAPVAGAGSGVAGGARPAGGAGAGAALPPVGTGFVGADDGTAPGISRWGVCPGRGDGSPVGAA